MDEKRKDYTFICAEDYVSDPKIVAAVLEVIESGEWSIDEPEKSVGGISGCVIEAVHYIRQKHPDASVEQLCSRLLFDSKRMRLLRSQLAQIHLKNKDISSKVGTVVKEDRKYIELSAEDCAASNDVVAAALDAIDSGKWTEDDPEKNVNGVRGCVIEAVKKEREMHPNVSVSQLSSLLLFDFEMMASLRVRIAQAYLRDRGRM